VPSWLKNTLALFSVPAGKPDLIAAQITAFTRQLPLLYFVLLANTLFVAATHIHVAPAWLALYIPALLTVLCIIRIWSWARLPRRELDHEASVARLQSTVLMVAGFGAAFTVWGLTLYPYGDAYQKLHVAYYMSITLIACILCLMHVRAAALLLTITVLVPFSLFFLTRGEPVMTAIAANVIIVGLAVMFVVFTHYRDFARMVEQRTELRRRQEEAEQLSRENLRLANSDSLTGLPNRRCFFTSIAHHLSAASATGETMAVGLVDLDGFKAVNDLYGHTVGDQLLIDASKRLMAHPGWNASFARLGGDEFGVILRGASHQAEIENFGREICTLLRQPYLLPNVTAEISASIGFAAYPMAGDTVERLIENADYALYQAKQKASGTAVVFNTDHALDIKKLNQIDQLLRNADLDREMTVVYQPIVNLESGRTVSAEALARWHSPVLGDVAPAQFIKAAERSDLINRLTVLLYRKALADMKSWPKSVGLSFNLSARDVASQDTILHLAAITLKSGIDPRRIEFEVTETAVMADFDQALSALTRLRSIGLRIGLDDFGTGYSSLGYVHRLPLDKVKIDIQFISDIADNRTARSIVKSVIDLARNLGFASLAEGVETEEQARIIHAMGCGFAQGYFFGRPMPGADLGRLAAGDSLSINSA